MRQKQGMYLIPLPALDKDSADRTRELTLLYETDDPRLSLDGTWVRFRTQRIRPRAPEVAVTTLATTWNVYPPRRDGRDILRR